jgi:predicted membrane protein
MLRKYILPNRLYTLLCIKILVNIPFFVLCSYLTVVLDFILCHVAFQSQRKAGKEEANYQRDYREENRRQ